MKLPLAIPLDSRNGNGQYDARPVNVLKESSAANESVVKRPALAKVTGPDAPVNGNGLVDFNGSLISVFGAGIGYAEKAYATAYFGSFPVSDVAKGLLGSVSDGNGSIMLFYPPVLSEDGGITWSELSDPRNLFDEDQYKVSSSSELGPTAAHTTGGWVVAIKVTELSITPQGFIAICRYANGAWEWINQIGYYPDTGTLSFCLSKLANDDLAVQLVFRDTGVDLGEVFSSSDYGSNWSKLGDATPPA